MVVLLGGVWVVSIHAGSGRVDVGTWQEGDDELDDEWEEVEEVPETRVTGPSAILSPRLESALSDSEAYRYRRPTSPSSVHQTSFFPTSPESEQGHHDYMTQSFTLPPTSPLGRSHSKARRKRRYSILQPSDSSTVPGGGGFSIGLSPVSPGFAIVPKRRISGMRRAVQRAIMRRTVSESDLNADLARSPPNTNSVAQAPNAESAEAGASGEGERRDRGKHIHAKARWQWLRGVFRGRDA